VTDYHAYPGNDLQVIIDLANDDDVIYLHPGIHRGPITINKKVSIRGYDPDFNYIILTEKSIDELKDEIYGGAHQKVRP